MLVVEPGYLQKTESAFFALDECIGLESSGPL